MNVYHTNCQNSTQLISIYFISLALASAIEKETVFLSFSSDLNCERIRMFFTELLVSVRRSLNEVCE